MSAFLERMAAASAARAAALRGSSLARELRARVGAMPAPRVPSLSGDGFDLIAEVKRRAPSAGVLAGASAAGDLAVSQARRYSSAGAATISVLTEPDAFDGSLDDLRRVASAVGTPAMRKDFLVDPIQLDEARDAGAAGALLILRLLDEETLDAMLDAAARCGLFVLLEAFDEADLDRAGAAVDAADRRGVTAWVGLNARDLTTLEIDPDRFERLVDRFPPGVPRIAESGVVDAAGAARVARLGYRALLCGSALMRAGDPASAVRAMLAAGRAAAGERSSCA